MFLFPIFRAKEAAKQLKKKLGSNSAKVIFLALIVTDMAMSKCGNPMHVQVGTKEFYNVLISILHNQEMKKEVRNLFFRFWEIILLLKLILFNHFFLQLGQKQSAISNISMGSEIRKGSWYFTSVFRCVQCIESKRVWISWSRFRRRESIACRKVE